MAYKKNQIFNKLIEYSRKETQENNNKLLQNINQSDVSKLKPYDNTAFLALVNYMIDLCKIGEDNNG